jgi:peptide/nickel transport system substrate-binding protein
VTGLGAAAAVGLSAACTAVSSEDSDEGPASADLTVAVSSLGKENIDPSIDTLATIGVIGAPIYDWLAWPGKDGTLGPGLATGWTESDDHLSWTIELGSATFSDGTPVTAEDVKFSIELHLDPDATSSLSGLWRSKVAGVTVNSPTSLTVELNSPWPTFPEALSPYEGAQGAVVPKAYYEEVGAEGFRAAPIGSGPWEFVRHDLGSGFVYRRGDPDSHRERPGYENLTIKLVAENSTRLAELLSGTVQIAEITPDQVAQVTGAGLQVLEIPDFTDTALTFFGDGDPRAADLPTGDVDVRRALALAINRTELVESVLAGYGTVPSRFIVGEGTLGHDPSWQPDPYDPAEAERLLAEAGYPDGFTVKVYSAPVAGAPWIPRAVEAIAGYWEAIGVRTEIVPTDYGTVSSLYRQRPLPDELIGAAMINLSQVTNSNITLLNAYYPSTSVVYLQPTPEMDALSAEASAARTQAELGSAITRMVEHAHARYVAFPLARTPSLFGAAATVDGWSPYKSGYLGMLLNELRPKT